MLSHNQFIQHRNNKKFYDFFFVIVQEITHFIMTCVCDESSQHHNLHTYIEVLENVCSYEHWAQKMAHMLHHHTDLLRPLLPNCNRISTNSAHAILGILSFTVLHYTMEHVILKSCYDSSCFRHFLLLLTSSYQNYNTEFS